MHELAPDLEKLWRFIKIRVSSRRHRVRTVEELKLQFKRNGSDLTEDYIESMHKRCKPAIRAKGGSIEY